MSYVDEGFWHPNVKAGQVHAHPEIPGGGWSTAAHKLCEPVYTRRGEPKTRDTIRRADGEPVWGEYEWVTGTDGWFDDIGEPVELCRETWALTDSATFWLFPTSHLGSCEIEDQDDCEEDAEHWWRSPDAVWMRVCVVHHRSLSKSEEASP